LYKTTKIRESTMRDALLIYYGRRADITTAGLCCSNGPWAYRPTGLVPGLMNIQQELMSSHECLPLFLGILLGFIAISDRVATLMVCTRV